MFDNMSLQTWLNALMLKTGTDVASTERPSSAQVAIVYGALGFVVSRALR